MKIFKRTLRLCSPKAIGSHFDGAEGVNLGSGLIFVQFFYLVTM